MTLFGGAWRRVARLRPGAVRPPAPAPAADALPLDGVRRRLELLLTAVYGRSIPIVAAPPPEPLPWYRRPFRAAPPLHPPASAAGAASDGEQIRLPAAIALDEGGPGAALARFRLLAFEQAERLQRGTATHVPEDDPLARDLYLLAESTAVDAALPLALPGLAPILAAERAAALRLRPPLDTLTGAEREVEAMIRAALARPPSVPTGRSPADSLAWARREAERLRSSGGPYRGIPVVGPWGTVVRSATSPARDDADDGPRGITPMSDPGLIEVAREGGTDDRDGTRTSGAEKGRAGADGDQTDTDRRQEPGEPVADALHRGVSSPGMGDAGSEHPSPDLPPEHAGEPVRRRTDPDVASAGVTYPEWDWRIGRYHPRGAVVREEIPFEGNEAWARAVLADYGGVVRRLREQFERLRARRVRLVRQPVGDEIDLAACVRALVDLRAGHAVDDRLYTMVRPARREISILLLVDISGSTDTVIGNTRIIDIEKVSLLLTAQALDALGDRYAVLTFSGEGATNVRVRTVKGFGDRNGAVLRRCIAALRPEGYTRMGTAIRHAAALLGAQRTAHQLLLILSDGKPNDSDHYAGRYGIEDSRQAIAEARALGVHPFCLTVDRKGSEYLTRIFGTSGHLVLRTPEQLPRGLLAVVQHLLRT